MQSNEKSYRRDQVGAQCTSCLFTATRGWEKADSWRKYDLASLEGFTWLEGRCFASTQTLSYAPILDLLRRQIEIADKQNVEEQQSALHRHVADNFPAIRRSIQSWRSCLLFP